MRASRIAAAMGIAALVVSCSANNASGKGSFPAASPSVTTLSTSPGPLASVTPIAPAESAPHPSIGPPRTSTVTVLYRSLKFEAPLSVSLDPQPRLALDQDTPHLLSWTSDYNSNNRVRLMIPAEYYPEGKGPARPAPADYSVYLKSMKSVTYTDVGTVTVDGVSGPIMTANVMHSMDGSIGCAVAGADQSDECFGFGPDLAIRIAVLKRRGTTVLIWARTNSTLPDTRFLEQFQQMLRSLQWN